MATASGSRSGRNFRIEKRARVSGDLRVVGIAHLDPTRHTIAAHVRRHLVLRDDTFEVMLAGECEEIYATLLDVIAIQQA